MNKNEFVIREGDEGKEFFIIEEGEVECLKLHKIGDKQGFVLVRELSSGDHFGEVALINKEKRSLSIRVKSQTTTLLRMDYDTFTRILGSIEEKLKKDYNKEVEIKMEELKRGRTMSQAFPASSFQEIRDNFGPFARENGDGGI
jgi:cAMP-dependent protein kinase regulator